MTELAVKFLPDQDYVVSFFDNFKVAFSNPFILNDCFESYILPEPNSQYVKDDLQLLLQDPRGSLCFCCSKLENIKDLGNSKSQLMWAHYSSENRGIAIIFNKDKAFSYLHKFEKSRIDLTEDPIYFRLSGYQYCYEGQEICYIDSNEDQYDNPNNYFDENLKSYSINHMNEQKEIPWHKIFAKNSVWKYEKEIRYVIPPTNEKIEKINDQYKYLTPINEEAIKGIAFANRFYSNENFARNILDRILNNYYSKNWNYYYLRKSTKFKKMEVIDITDLINKTQDYYLHNKHENGQIIDDLLNFFKEQDNNFFLTEFNKKHAFQNASNNLGSAATGMILSLHQRNDNHQDICNKTFKLKIDSIQENEISYILKKWDIGNINFIHNTPFYDKYPLSFFRIKKFIDQKYKLNYDEKSRNKRVLNNFGFELRCETSDTNTGKIIWRTIIIKVPKNDE